MARLKQRIVRRVRPLVILQKGVDAHFLAILPLAAEWGWDLLSLSFIGNSIPDNPPPAGAFVSCLPTDPLAKRLRKLGCPAVRLGSLPHSQDRVLPAVIPDLAAAGRMAADHFAERRFRDVAFIGYNPSDPDSDFHAMYAAFRKRAGERGLSVHLHELCEGFQQVSGKEGSAAKYERQKREIGSWLATLPKPVGVFAYSDHLSAVICTVCKAAGLAVPEQVAVLGVGNDPLTCELSPVRMSSIDLGRDEVGRQAALLLRCLMDGRAAPAKRVMVPPRGVVERQSTDVLAVPDLVVARAIRFIWGHIDQHLLVDDVARDAGVSRRQLERAFRRHLRHGVNAELHRKRLERVCALLKSTKSSIAVLAPMAGFRSVDYLHRSFRRAFGMTPLKYRKSGA
jgi:LacI family transcriptional regulator